MKLRKKAFKKLRETKKQRRKGCWKERGKEAKKQWDNEEEKKKRSKSCGHGCTKRDSGCTQHLPILGELCRAVIYGNKERMERDTRSSQLPWR